MIRYLAILALAFVAISFLFYAFSKIGPFVRRIFYRLKKRNTLEGVIDQRRVYCEKQIEKIEKEIAKINADITDLDLLMLDKEDLKTDNIKKTELIRISFEEEISLRKTKISFFRSCIENLDAMIKNYLLNQSIESKKKKLKALKEKNLEDQIELENFNYDLNSDKEIVKGIDLLSNKMPYIDNIETALELQKELSQLTKDINES